MGPGHVNYDLRSVAVGVGQSARSMGLKTFCSRDSIMLLIIEALKRLLFMWVTSMVFTVLEIKTENI